MPFGSNSARDCSYRIGSILRIDSVNLIRRDHLRSGCNLRIIGFQFFIDGIDILNGISSLRTGRIHDMDDHLGTFDVAQEFVSQTDSLGSSLDQSRNIRNDETTGFLPDPLHPDSDSGS